MDWMNRSFVRSGTRSGIDAEGLSTHLSLPAVPALLVELAKSLDDPAPNELPVSRCGCSGESLPSRLDVDVL